MTKARLRDFVDGDFPQWEGWLQPGHAWQKLDAPYLPKPRPEEAAAMIARERERAAAKLPPPRHRRAIADAATDAFLGVVTWSWISRETAWPEAGLVLFDEACWGKGYGTAALGLWTDELFRALPKIRRVDLRTWSGNAGMVRVAEKVGYRLEARFREARTHEGRPWDGLGFGILRSEWATLHPAGFKG